MIVVCEPQCTGMSHEKVNSGFLYGLRLAYPQDTIRFYAENSHIDGIKNILANDHITVENIEYIPIRFDDPYSIRGTIVYYFLFKKIFTDILSEGINKIFFLSTNPIILYLIKRLTKNSRFHNIQCTIVLHGEFENIAFDYYRELPIPQFPIEPISEIAKAIGPKQVLKKIITDPGTAIRKIYELIRFRIIIKIGQINSELSMMFRRNFHIKKSMLWRHSSNYHYIIMSPHALNNAKKYIDVNELNLYDIVMPTNFAKPTPQPSNDYVKFAVFGYGNSVMLHKAALLLEQKEIKNPYEIRVISMDSRGTDGFPNIHCVSPGRQMYRWEMEQYTPDIDIFLSFYEKDRYQLSCSASALEAISYIKPILHLDNDTMNYFNKPEAPIGYLCANLEAFVEKMVDIINNYSAYKSELQTFRNNILKLREENSMERLAPKIKQSFTFE